MTPADIRNGVLSHALMALWTVMAMMVIVISPAKADPCDVEKCQLPDCHCSGTAIPGRLPVADTPQVGVCLKVAVNG